MGGFAGGFVAWRFWEGKIRGIDWSASVFQLGRLECILRVSRSEEIEYSSPFPFLIFLSSLSFTCLGRDV